MLMSKCEPALRPPGITAVVVLFSVLKLFRTPLSMCALKLSKMSKEVLSKKDTGLAHQTSSCHLLLPVIWQLLAHSSFGTHRKSILPHESATPARTTNKLSNIHLLCQFICLQMDHQGGNATAILSLAYNPVFQCSFQCWKFARPVRQVRWQFGSLVMTSFFFFQ